MYVANAAGRCVVAIWRTFCSSALRTSILSTKLGASTSPTISFEKDRISTSKFGPSFQLLDSSAHCSGTVS